MMPVLAVFASLAVGGADPVDVAIERYRAVGSYRVTLRSSYGESSDVIRYSYKKPGFVRMDFVQPHKGAVLIYSPLTRKVRLWPFGTGLFSLSLSPDNPLVQSPTGQRVDRSDIGALLDNVKALQRNGESAVLGEEIVAGKKTLRIAVTGKGRPATGNVQRYDLWLDSITLLPLKVVSRDARGDVIETVLMDDLDINVELGNELFDP
ncbi:MAG TPA: sigma-E factor regulatory protein RseB domain-containing protein [Burkholderiales bacterium]|nr:sigma-E factor regulatory protein RseB domain-containing protein [Burkholderiales bacterium]